MDKNVKKLKPFSTKKITVDEIDKVWFGKFGFKDENKKIVIEAQYASCGEFSCGLCPVAYQSWYYTPEGRHYYEMHWGYIDENGKEVIPFRFRDARNFNKYGVAAVCDEYGSNYYLIDTRGRKLYGGKNIEFYRLYDLDNRYMEFALDPDGWHRVENNMGVYDTKKKKVFLGPHTGGIIEWSEDEIKVYEYSELGAPEFFQYYINSKGEVLYPGLVNKGFNIVERPDKYGFAVVAIFEVNETKRIGSGFLGSDGKHYERIERYGVANLAGELVIPAEYDMIYEKEAGNFICRKDGQEQMISLKKE